MSEVTFEITLLCDPDDDEAPIPTEADMEGAVLDGLDRIGLTVGGVTAERK